jgi:hypothetical protein
MAKKKTTTVPNLGELQKELMEASGNLGEAQSDKEIADKAYAEAVAAHQSATVALRSAMDTILEKFE